MFLLLNYLFIDCTIWATRFESRRKLILFIAHWSRSTIIHCWTVDSVYKENWESRGSTFNQTSR